MHDIIRLILAMCVSQGILVLSIISVAVFFYFQDQPKSSHNTSSLNEEELTKIRRKRMAAIKKARVVAKVDKDKKKTNTQKNTSQPTTPKTIDTSRGSEENWLVETSLEDIVSNANSHLKEEIEVNSSSSISSVINSNKNVSTYVDDTKGWGSGQEVSEEEDSNSTSECLGEEEDRIMRIGIVPDDSRERTQQAIAKYLAGSARVMSAISPNENTKRIHIEGMFMSQQDDDNGSSNSSDDSSEDGSDDSSTISSLSACSNLDIYAQDVQTNAIEDIIIRHMKERKTILQQQLVSYIQSWYCYTLQSVEINNGIEALVHKGYLERRVGDSERLRYVPLM